MSTLRIDNVSAVKLLKYPKFHNRSKHIEIRYHFVREKYLDGVLNVEHLDGENKGTDRMTKRLLACLRFEKLRGLIGLCSLKSLN